MKQKHFNRKSLIKFRQWGNKRYSAFNSLHKLIKICTLAFAYSIIVKPAHTKAQGTDSTSEKITEIGEVTVQSTLIEMKNAETGRSIEIISSAQIQSLPITTIDELLRYIPGIDAQQRDAFGAQTDFSLRGSSFNQGTGTHRWTKNQRSAYSPLQQQHPGFTFRNRTYRNYPRAGFFRIWP